MSGPPQGARGARVSIVTTSYNQGPFLQANLDSVRAQGDVILEHLVVDGASSDGSVALLAAAARRDGRLRFLSEPDGGQSDALDKALRMSRGEIIGWLNSDDVYRPEAVRRALDHLDADPSLGLVYGHCDKLDAAGRVIGRVDAHPVGLEDLLAQDTIPQPSCFLRRSVLQRTGGVDVTLRYAMDYDLWLRAALHGVRARAVDEVWAGFRVHEASKSCAESHLFQPELERVMERALSSPLLPAELRGRRAALRRRFHGRLCLAAYARLQLPLSRRHGVRALLAEARLPEGRLVACLLKGLLGERLVRAARRDGGAAAARSTAGEWALRAPAAPAQETAPPAAPPGPATAAPPGAAAAGAARAARP